MNNVSTTKLHHKLVAVTAERDALAAELQKLKSAPVRGMNEEMLESVDQEARRRYRKFMSSARGTTITASDSFESWLVWVSWEFAMNECHADHYSMLGRIAEAESELQKLREQKPVAWMHDKGGRVDTCHDSVKELWIKVGQKQNTQFMREIVPCRVEHYNIPLYAAPVPAPAVPVGDGWFYRDGEEAIRISAPSVPEEWRKSLQEAHDTFQRYADLHRAKDTPDGHEKAKANQKLANKLYALLQSAEVTK